MTSPAPKAIVAGGLVKRYKDGTYAVRGVSFEVAAGEIVGLVGPNGAGKSSVLNMLATLIVPTAGSARIFGVPLSDRSAVRRLVGIALQASGLDPLMSVSNHFEVHAALYGIPAREARRRSRRLLDDFQLSSVYQRRAGELSGGTQRRLSLALALLHNPKAIIFDEPTVGLDPNVRRDVWEVLENLRAQGLAVLFSTHYMDEADRLCKRIYLMSQGLVVATGSPHELKSRITADSLRLRIHGDPDRAAKALSQAAAGGLLPAQDYYDFQDNVIEVKTEVSGSSLSPLVSLLEDAGIAVADLHWGHGTLDDVFTQLATSTADETQLPAVTMEHRALARRSGRSR